MIAFAVTAVFALFRYKHGAWKSKVLVEIIPKQ